VIRMAGIFGGVNLTENKPPEYLATEMSSRLGHGEDWFRAKCLCHPPGFHGVVDFKSRLESSWALSNGKMLSLYEEGGLNFTKHLNGSFVTSIYDEDKRKIIVVNDRYGSKNLFYTISKDGLFYSSEIKAILAQPSIKPKLTPEAVAEFFTFSYLLGNKTFFQAIELLPPASILSYDCKQGIIQIENYWDFEFHQNREPKALEIYLAEFDSVMEKAVEIRMTDKDKMGIFLSGGLDSRLMAGFAKRVADKKGKELVSFTFGTKKGWQEKIARQVADRLGIENEFYEIPADMVANYAEEVVYKGDGQIRVRDAHFISLLSKVRTQVDTVLVGLFCSELFGEHFPQGILGVPSKEELADYLFNRERYEQVAQHIPKMFSTELPIDLEKVRVNFIDTVMEIPFDSPGEIANYWELRQRDRRYIIPLSNYMSWYLDTRLPYSDNEVVDFALRLPLELRFKKAFIHKALRNIFPNLACIHWEKSGVQRLRALAENWLQRIR